LTHKNLDAQCESVQPLYNTPRSFSLLLTFVVLSTTIART